MFTIWYDQCRCWPGAHWRRLGVSAVLRPWLLRGVIVVQFSVFPHLSNGRNSITGRHITCTLFQPPAVTALKDFTACARVTGAAANSGVSYRKKGRKEGMYWPWTYKLIHSTLFKKIAQFTAGFRQWLRWKIGGGGDCRLYVGPLFVVVGRAAKVIDPLRPKPP